VNIAIVGYGRMGKAIEQLATERGHHVSAIIDPVLSEPGTSDVVYAREVSTDALAGADVAIEFSVAAGVAENVRRYASTGIGAVIGTTGWADSLAEVEESWRSSTRGLVHGSNFSIGANLFLRAAEYAASLVAELEEYDLLIHEMHHGKKKDSPSGTAFALAKRVMKAAPRKRRVRTDPLYREANPAELHISSSRGGSFPGTHTLFLDSDADTIEIRHQARHRGGFVLGAVRAAEWIVDRTGIFTVDQFVSDLLSAG
jgi:4-hydroxy-tetrahydrodipicolinate reductase